MLSILDIYKQWRCTWVFCSKTASQRYLRYVVLKKKTKIKRTGDTGRWQQRSRPPHPFFCSPLAAHKYSSIIIHLKWDFDFDAFSKRSSVFLGQGGSNNTRGGTKWQASECNRSCSGDPGETHWVNGFGVFFYCWKRTRVRGRPCRPVPAVSFGKRRPGDPAPGTALDGPATQFLWHEWWWRGIGDGLCLFRPGLQSHQQLTAQIQHQHAKNMTEYARFDVFRQWGLCEVYLKRLIIPSKWNWSTLLSQSACIHPLSCGSGFCCFYSKSCFFNSSLCSHTVWAA